MKITTEQGLLTEVKSEVLIINIFEETKILSGAIAKLDDALGNIISKNIIEKDEFKGKFLDTYVIPTYGKIPADKILLIGLGKPEEFNLNRVREAASKAVKKAISFLKAKNISSILHGADLEEISAYDSAQMIAEGTLLGAYNFDKYKSKKDEEPEIKDFKVIDEDASKIEHIKEGLDRGIIMAEATNFARNLVNEPASVITPSSLAEIAKDLENIECKILEKEEVEKLGMGAYLAVGQGSNNPPKFIHMTYKSENPKKKLAIVGKGITFDSGGLDIKPANSMRNMKDDMAGAAATLSIMKVLSKFNPEVEIHGIIAACENMPGGKAYKPGDVLKAMNGKTIEVDNTDAEGRLTLADALCYAESLKPDLIIDMATLTGACVVALGEVASGIMGNNQELIDDLVKAANIGGERFWQLPMFKEYFDDLKSDIADFKNSGSRNAGASGAGLFLKEFVNDTPWAHIDIAGPAYLSKDIKELSKGASGAGVRALLNYILSL